MGLVGKCDACGKVTPVWVLVDDEKVYLGVGVRGKRGWLFHSDCDVCFKNSQEQPRHGISVEVYCCADCLFSVNDKAKISRRPNDEALP